ncbi:zinc-binding alcohol dehydrogenase [Paenibacillus sp. S150]|uniref:zinc-dependent alcohol dehydrogenase n=1 Tax=Paenibacillus sp. S150 TaxID=2749826 RepID=UPI001C598107|nr:zinc-binding alcohol dehydrogenase [Paenibacillus sp. S150]MBW4080776.1 zinc-binding alcohol dehydrogenase [Paenibacillus sp. S150]
MKAVISEKGQISVADIPAPVVEDGFVLVETEYSAISPGTEIMMNGTHRPKPIVLGYSAAGVIRSRGKGMEHWPEGQRVACYGAPYAKHAEWLLMPQHLMVPVPEHVSPAEASTVGLGAIAVHAVRQAGLQFGETLVLIGAGILGQLIAQIAKAAGCRVIVYDLLAERCGVAENLGIRHIAANPERVGQHLGALTAGMGADAVIICAGGKSGGLVDQALEWVRNQGKVLLVGDVKPDFSRELMFGKEAQVLISRAGGPGRYDPVYEKQGIDYPYGYVRWTEGRNMAEYIRLISEGDIRVKPLISEVFPLECCADAFRRYAEAPAELLGAVLAYPAAAVQDEAQTVRLIKEGQGG